MMGTYRQRLAGLSVKVPEFCAPLPGGFYSFTPQSRDPRVPPAKAHRLKRLFFSGRA
jgi:hypothetical protein